MLDSKSFVELIKKAANEAAEAGEPSDFCYGKVTSISPLKILVEQKMELGKAQLVLTRNVTDFQTKISFDNPDIKQPFTTWNMPETIESSQSKIAFKAKIQHEITVYNALKVGDEVVLIKKKGGQKYLVLDRVVAL